MKLNINFMKFRKFFIILSAAMALICIALLAFKGLNWGIDFTGGNLIQIEVANPTEVGDVRSVLAAAGEESATIQSYSDRGFIIRLRADNEGAREEVVNLLKASFEGTEVLRIEKVGPTIGGELRSQAFWALGVALLGILIYVTFRFQFRFAVVSVIALMHDSLMVLGVFSLFGVEINSNFIAAILTIVGYSLNNTIVILDRVRENWKDRNKISFAELINESINQTLSRTINTSLTTFFPVLAFYIWGGPVLAAFSLAMLLGIVFGTYSSVCMVGSVLVEWYNKFPEKKRV